MSGKDETVATTAATPRGPVKVEVAYRYHWIGTTVIGLSLAEAIELASHKPLGAYVARWFPEG
jgi:hypothetical protein